jgi:protein involved in polysaccharide export with SLBB domain
VRLPLIGSVTVRGLTAKQAQAAIAKQLTDRKLAATSVEVSVRRPQGSER